MQNATVPFVSIIVICLNEEKNLPRCLASIRRECDAAWSQVGDVEVLVVDGGSTDQSPAIAQQHGARVIRSERGIPKQRNAGARQAHGQIIVYVDADIELLPGWLATIRRHFTPQDTFKILGCPPRLPEDASWIARAYAMHWGLPDAADKHVDATRVLSTASLVLGKDVYDRVGGFREDLAVEEDHYLVLQAQQLGAHVLYDHALAYVHHGEPRTLEEFYRRFLWGANRQAWFDDIRSGDFRRAWRPRYVYGSAIAAELAALGTSVVAGPFGGWQIGVPLSLGALGATVLGPALRTAHRHHAYDRIGQLSLMYGAYGLSTAAAIVGLGKKKSRRWR